MSTTTTVSHVEPVYFTEVELANLNLEARTSRYDWSRRGFWIPEMPNGARPKPPKKIADEWRAKGFVQRTKKMANPKNPDAMGIMSYWTEI